VELCPHKICWGPSPGSLWMQPYLETRSHRLDPQSVDDLIQYGCCPSKEGAWTRAHKNTMWTHSPKGTRPYE
jgi:hypothetical protein